MRSSPRPGAQCSARPKAITITRHPLLLGCAQVAPITSQHIFTLARLGCYTSNHFFRVDKGFVAQTADVIGGRSVPLNDEQQVRRRTARCTGLMHGRRRHVHACSVCLLWHACGPSAPDCTYILPCSKCVHAPRTHCAARFWHAAWSGRPRRARLCRWRSRRASGIMKVG